MAQKDTVPTLYIETVNQGDSGFTLQGTEGTPYAQGLHAPTVEWIPTESIEAYMDEDKEGKKTLRHRPIRHIKGCESIYPKEQEEKGFKPHRMNDKIPLDSGFATIKREGGTIGTYEYLTRASYFLDNPLRPSSADAIYKQVKTDEKAVSLVDEDEILTAAKHKVYDLRLNVGMDGDKKVYKYNEDKIDAYCKMLNISEETYERKTALLLYKAIQNPRQFLNIVVKAEQTVITEINHALQLGVIMFEGNSAQYVKDSKVITSVGTTKMSNDKKIEALSTYLQTQDGNNDLTELRIKIEAAKEEQFSKK